MNKSLSFVSALALGGSLSAVETDLRLGLHEVVAGLELRSQHVTAGREYSDEPAVAAKVAGRLFNFGISTEAIGALTDDEYNAVKGGEVREATLRLDYLIEIPRDYMWFGAQIMPHYKIEWEPDQSLQSNKEPHWLGVDAWIMLPLEGSEIGGSFDIDADDNHGWHASAGARQFITYAPVDLSFWQVVNFGGSRYHQYRTDVTDKRPEEDFLLLQTAVFGIKNGIPANNFKPFVIYQAIDSANRTHKPAEGITTIEAGAKVTMPMIWENSWATISCEGQWWVQRRDRHAVRDNFELIIGVGLEYRFNSPDGLFDFTR